MRVNLSKRKSALLSHSEDARRQREGEVDQTYQNSHNKKVSTRLPITIA